MLIFEEFPEGNDFWMIKAVDRFRQPHALSESASVDVLLQKLDGWWGDHGHTASAEQIASVMAISPQGRVDFRVARIHAGSLPAVRVGQIYRDKVYRFELPTAALELELPEAEKSFRAVSLNHNRPMPATWDSRYPLKVLLSTEFYVESDWREQQVLLGKTHDGRDVILPRMVVFQTFYGPHSEMADALTSGPWEKVRSRLICYEELENGLVTRDAPELNEWHLVLETAVTNDFRWQIALFEFDSYAQTQVRRLYGDAMSQRVRGRTHWFCSATLPFDTRYPMWLNVKGYHLANTSKARTEGAFLVTSIMGASRPVYVPGLAWNRRNSGDEGGSVIVVDEPPPYRRNVAQLRVDEAPVLESAHAPSVSGDVAVMETASFGWLGKAEERELPKKSSKRYDRSSSPSPSPEVRRGTYSSAKPVAGGQAVRALRLSAQVGTTPPAFQDLIRCLRQLEKEGYLEAVHLVQPDDLMQRAERGGLIVWNLLDADYFLNGRRPRKRWRMINTRASLGEAAVGRTVLIVHVLHRTKRIVLFEVESKLTESGFLLGALCENRTASFDVQDVCRHMVLEIVRAEGRRLDDVADRVAIEKDVRWGGAYKHRYSRKRSLDTDALLVFLNSLEHLHPIRPRRNAS